MTSQLVTINVKEKEFQKLMHVYELAIFQVKSEFDNMKVAFNNFYQYDVINSINCRIKSPKSIINKMKKKQYKLNYKNLIENIDDIAGIRIICTFKSDIKKVINIIENNPNIQILQKKDYINVPKKSGYSGYHIIAQTEVDIGDAIANVKVEIQIRTMAMDFWSTTEHKIKYKARNKLSKSDSNKMIRYAKMINRIDEMITKIHNKYEKI